MPNAALLETFDIMGNRPDEWAVEYWYQLALQGGSSGEPSGGGGGLALLPPVPLLDPFIVEPPAPPPRVVPLPVTTGVLGAVLGGLAALVFPQPMGPPELDEAPSGGNPRPPAQPPGATDPNDMPNWDEIATPRPGVDYSDPIKTPGVFVPDFEPDVLLDTFVVSPPRAAPSPFAQPAPFSFLEIFPYGPFAFPSGNPRPGLQPDTIGAPRIDIVPRIADPLPDVRAEPKAEPIGAPAPNPLGAPFPDIFAYPWPDAGAVPDVPGRDTEQPPNVGNPGTGATPRQPFVDTLPEPFADPIMQPFPFDAQPPALPPADADSCDCDGKKKKDRKKRKDRDVCYRGTYTQRKRGISYRKLEEVPCETGLGSRSSSSPSAPGSLRTKSTYRKRRAKQPSLGDLARDVFGL